MAETAPAHGFDAAGPLEKDVTTRQSFSNNEDNAVIEEGSTLEELTSHLRLTITESEASTSCACGEEGDPAAALVEVEAILGTNLSLLEPCEKMDNDGEAVAAAGVVSPLKLDGTLDQPLNEVRGKTSMAHLDGAVSDDSIELDKLDKQGSSESVAKMNDRPCSPEQTNGNAGTDSSPLNWSMAATIANESSALSTSLQNHADEHEPSSSLDALLGQVAKVVSDAESSSVILSDAGESKCTFNSTAPVVNLTVSGEDAHDVKLVALGAFAKAATDDGQTAHDIIAQDSEPSFYTATDGSAHGSLDDNNVIKTTISSGSASPFKEIEARALTLSKLGRISPIDTAGPGAGGREPLKSTRNQKSPIPISPSSCYSTGDKKRLSERLKQRLAKRNQMHAAAGSPTRRIEEDSPTSSKPGRDASRDRSQWETRLQAASRQKRRSKSRANSESESNERTNSDILSKYSASSEVGGAQSKVYPDAVTFSDGEEDATALRVNTKGASRDRRSAYRKCVSEVGVSLSLSARAARTKLSKHHHSHLHGIGILQADGIVYDDALLLRLARQARYGHLRGEVSHAVANDATGASAGDHRYNDVKIHVYDLLTNDSLVEVPYFNCNFPIGQCFKVVNDGCHSLGTGAYHVGVEVNGVEYAFGANNIIGMSGIFTCVPRESPGYEYRETLDFGKLHTTKRTWIRIPKAGMGASFKTISAALGGSVHNGEKNKNSNAPLKDMKDYSFREIESFADGHAIIHSMAREYMGTDYDLLRKNCCTFARDMCIRLDVQEENIPRWFHNAAQAGADTEDAITNVENSMRSMLDCAEGGDPLDMECYNHGFECIIDETDKTATKLKVVESPQMRTPRERRPLSDDLCESVHETASWTY
mmetsp:Transcript_8567/g.19215  ORF Transcript_8567/g.19215 Transcript_8567/m.19215 type:complete len:877 (+) Transcript_8567:165-2795(+)